ncbi:hypothetical protein TNCV_746341 [Trichonephila clavipes]|nr:hypothetical protein TNCV_746341 [Trichonephila clavipes]
MHISSVHSSSSYWSITSRDGMGYTSRSPIVRIKSPLYSARYISCVLRPVTLPVFRPFETSRFSRIMHDRMLPVLYELSLIPAVALDLHVPEIPRQ